jgi:3-oxoacyl-[acyl-carrier protein] reductase
MGKLDGRVAIVTGAGRGIGRATAELFAAEGARIAVATRTASAGEETVAAIKAAGGEAFLVACDVGSRQACTGVIDATVEHYGRLDIVLHNAAYIPLAPLGALADTELDKLLDVGLKAAFWLCYAALAQLENSPAARILVTSSSAGNTGGVVGLVHYGAMKAGLNGFVRGAALELARRGVTVNAVQPGFTLTASAERNSSPAAIRAMTSPIPIARPGLPREMAEAFLYLASDAAAYVTGQILAIDGGATLGNPQGLKFDQLE